MLYGLAAAAMAILPDSPIQKFLLAIDDTAFADIMGIINYFIPVGVMLGMLSTWLLAVAVWYVVRWLLRLVQYID